MTATATFPDAAEFKTQFSALCKWALRSVNDPRASTGFDEGTDVAPLMHLSRYLEYTAKVVATMPVAGKRPLVRHKNALASRARLMEYLEHFELRDALEREQDPKKKKACDKALDHAIDLSQAKKLGLSLPAYRKAAVAAQEAWRAKSRADWAASQKKERAGRKAAKEAAKLA